MAEAAARDVIAEYMANVEAELAKRDPAEHRAYLRLQIQNWQTREKALFRGTTGGAPGWTAFHITTAVMKLEKLIYRMRRELTQLIAAE